MRYGLLFFIPFIFYPFALQYLRTGTINRYQLIAMIGVVIAMGPRLLDLWTSIVVPKPFQRGWLLLWMVGWIIWLFRHRTAFECQEFTWGENPRTPAERLAAAVTVAMFLGVLVLMILGAA